MASNGSPHKKVGFNFSHPLEIFSPQYLFELLFSNHTRVLYSTKIKMFPWIPEFIVNILTGKALVEVSERVFEFVSHAIMSIIV